MTVFPQGVIGDRRHERGPGLHLGWNLIQAAPVSDGGTAMPRRGRTITLAARMERGA